MFCWGKTKQSKKEGTSASVTSSFFLLLDDVVSCYNSPGWGSRFHRARGQLQKSLLRTYTSVVVTTVGRKPSFNIISFPSFLFQNEVMAANLEIRYFPYTTACQSYKRNSVLLLLLFFKNINSVQWVIP